MNKLNALFHLLPRNSQLLYRFCRKYANRYNGENDNNMLTNGEVNLLKNYLPTCQTVFDVGSHFGRWSRLALAVKSDISLHCFEPSRSTFQRVDGSLSPKTIYNNFGLGREQGTRPYYIFADCATTNSLFLRKGLEDGWGKKMTNRTETVLIRTLDDYCREKNIARIDFLKIDTEGGEYDILCGARQMLSQNAIGIVQFEYGGCFIDAHILLKDVFEYFEQFPRYKLFKIFPNEMKMIVRYDQRLENFQYANYVAMIQD